jgi:hypothetical protein
MTMTKKRLLLIAAVPLVIAVILGVLAMLPPSPGVTKANFDRIEKGMTVAEVEGIFGGEGEEGEVTRDDKALIAEILGQEFERDGKSPKVRGDLRVCRTWGANDGSGAQIEFVDDCVVDKHWFDSHETVLDKIRRWLHLP